MTKGAKRRVNIHVARLTRRKGGGQIRRGMERMTFCSCCANLQQCMLVPDPIRGGRSPDPGGGWIWTCRAGMLWGELANPLSDNTPRPPVSVLVGGRCGNPVLSSLSFYISPSHQTSSIVSAAISARRQSCISILVRPVSLHEAY